MAIGRLQDRLVTPFTFDVATLTGKVATAAAFVDTLDTATDGVYGPLASTSDGSGTGATFTVTIVSNAVSDVTLNGVGVDYAVGDTLVIDWSLITGAGSGTVASTVATILGEVATVGTFVGGTGWLVGDVIAANETSSDGAGAGFAATVATASAIVGDSPETGGVPATLTITAGGVDYDVADTQTYIGTGEIGVLAGYVDHDQYELGGSVDEYLSGTGLTITYTVASTVIDAISSIDTAGKNFVVGTQVRVIDTVDATNDSAYLQIDAVDATGGVTALSILSGGTGYTATGGELCSAIELKTDAPEVYWQGTLTGVWNPALAPSTSSDDNDPKINVVRLADAAQLTVQKRMIDGGTVTVWAEPTLVDSEGKIVGNEVRAEDCCDQFRCEAKGFIWVKGSTGDADASEYGYCREETITEFKTRTDGAITAFSECVAGTLFDGVDTCDLLDSTFATGAELINDAVTAEDIGLQKAMRDCEVSGNFWDVTTDTCIAGDTPANFDLATFTFGTPTAGQTGSSNGSDRDYLANACRNLDYIWNYADQTCNATVDPATLTTQVLCGAAGYTWVAGACYNPNDFGDGHSRNATTQEDPNVAPK